jgi:hypothetical protein
MFFELAHYDTCLPDSFGGHHLPHLQVSVDNTTTAQQVKEQLRSELNEGAIGGCTSYEVTESDLFHYLANQAIDDLEIKVEKPFSDLEPCNDCFSSVYAYFVLIPNNTIGQEISI